jgi:hypothetical protein
MIAVRGYVKTKFVDVNIISVAVCTCSKVTEIGINIITALCVLNIEPKFVGTWNVSLEKPPPITGPFDCALLFKKVKKKCLRVEMLSWWIFLDGFLHSSEW